MTYHFGRDGQQIGSHSREEALVRIQNGEIRPTDLVWTEGMATWETVAQVFGSTPPPSPQPPSPPAPPQPPAPPTPPVLRPPAYQPLPPSEKPANYLIQSILVTLFCCLVPGIVAIIYASQVDSKFNAGDLAGALASSKSAKTWCWVAFGIGVVLTLGTALLYIPVILAGFSAAHY